MTSSSEGPYRGTAHRAALPDNLAKLPIAQCGIAACLRPSASCSGESKESECPQRCCKARCRLATEGAHWRESLVSVGDEERGVGRAKIRIKGRARLYTRKMAQQVQKNRALSVGAGCKRTVLQVLPVPLNLIIWCTLSILHSGSTSRSFMQPGERYPDLLAASALAVANRS